jgi:chromatin remodeling complex protein RSC6
MAEVKASGKRIRGGVGAQVRASPELSKIVGADPLTRAEVVSRVWTYIKSKNLQNPENKREIVADEALVRVFGKPKVTMFEMNKHLTAHLSTHGAGGGRDD